MATGFAQPQVSRLQDSARFLLGQANRYAWLGLTLAACSLVLATLLTCLIEFGRITFENIVTVQGKNPALWALDLMPLLFMAWGQYIGTVLAYQAGAMVLDETRSLREQASLLEYQLQRHTVSSDITGLPNRAAFIAETGKIIGRRKLRAGESAILVIDTDQYHEVERSAGETAAKELILQLSNRIQNILAEDEYLAHFGSDDFAILMPKVGHEADSRRLAGRIQLALDTPLTIQRQSMSLRVAIGIAHFPAHADEPELLLRRAEIAKFAAASAHRDYALYDPELETTRSRGPRLLADLHSALTIGALCDEYELQRPLREGLAPRLRLTPYWPHPAQGRMEETAFLNLASRASLVHSLSLWLLRSGLSRLVAWRKSRAGLGLVVRLPDAAFAQLPVADVVFRLLTAYELPAHAATLEVGQRGLLNGGGHALAQLQQLRAHGVGICLTDVGDAGSSPASRLYFPLDEIRTVPGLLRRAIGDAEAKAVLRSFTALARELKLRVIVSGVVDEPALEFGERLDADYLEGSAVAKRLTPTDITGKRAPIAAGADLA